MIQDRDRLDDLVASVDEFRLETRTDTYQPRGLTGNHERLQNLEQQTNQLLQRLQRYSIDIKHVFSKQIQTYLTGRSEPEYEKVREYFKLVLGKLTVHLPKPYRKRQAKTYTMNDVRDDLKTQLNYTRDVAVAVESLVKSYQHITQQVEILREEENTKSQAAIQERDAAVDRRKDLKKTISSLEETLEKFRKGTASRQRLAHSLGTAHLLLREAEDKAYQSHRRYILLAKTEERMTGNLDYLAQDLHELRLAYDYLTNLATNFELLTLRIEKSESVMTTLHEAEIHKNRGQAKVNGAQQLMDTLTTNGVLDRKKREKDILKQQMDDVFKESGNHDSP